MAANPLDLEMVSFFLEEASDLLIRWEQICFELEKKPSPDLVQELFRIAHNLKGSSRSVGLERFAEFVHKVEDFITLLKCGAAIDSKTVKILLTCHRTLTGWIGILKNDPSGLYPEQELQAVREDLLGCGAKKVMEPEGAQAPEAPPPVPAVSEANVPPAVVTEACPPAKKAAPAESLRISVDKLDNLIQMVGELSIYQSILLHKKQNGEGETKAFSDALQMTRKITREVQSHALSLRMLPVQPLFQRLERVARDVAGELGKKVEIVLSGTDVELDKMVIEKITDPLVHMVRNAVDHGIEVCSERIAGNKPAMARVEISARAEASHVVITVADDGKGLNREKIEEKAAAKNMIPAGTKLTDEQIYGLIFLPGFSTKEQVTQFSGRGVGMEVVKKAIDSVGGSIAVSSMQNCGSTFQISLPTSVSIMEALLVEVENLQYVVPVQNLEEILDCADYGVEWFDQCHGKFILRDQVLPLVCLRCYLIDGADSIPEPSSSRVPALVVRVNNERVAFLIDRICGQQHIVTRPLPPKLAKMSRFNGGTILGNGEPGFILDLHRIGQEYLQKLAGSAEKGLAA